MSGSGQRGASKRRGLLETPARIVRAERGGVAFVEHLGHRLNPGRVQLAKLVDVVQDLFQIPCIAGGVLSREAEIGESRDPVDFLLL